MSRKALAIPVYLVISFTWTVLAQAALHPSLTWNTFMGSSNYDNQSSLKADYAGNIYVAGTSYETWGSPINAHSGSEDIFLAKLGPAGNRIWNTFTGTNGIDSGYDLALDGDGNIYVCGQSQSGGELVGSKELIDTSYAGGMDVYIAKFDNNGNRLWQTFLGSASEDYGRGISLDASGNIYITGYSDDTWGAPILGHSGGYDVFIARLNSDGSLVWNTFMGSISDDIATCIVSDDSGNLTVGGYSTATWGNPVRGHSGYEDVLVARLNSSGALQWHTFLGSSSTDMAYGVDTDTSGSAYVIGYSEATWGAPKNGHSGVTDVLTAKLDLGGNLLWHTFLGSSTADEGHKIDASEGGWIYLAGLSEATWGSPIIAHNGASDAFAAKLDQDGIMVWNTFMGSTSGDIAQGIQSLSPDTVLVGGTSDNAWGSPINPYGGGGAGEAFAARFAPPEQSLTVKIAGDGSGKITSNPAGIDCGSACGNTFPDMSTVELTAAAGDAHSKFSGWSGDCLGSDPKLIVAMERNKTCVANFIKLDSVSHSVTVPPGRQASQFMMVAVGLNPYNPSPGGVIGSQIGQYDTTQMRIGCWCPIGVNYREYPDLPDAYPGYAFWALMRNGKTFHFSGTKPDVGKAPVSEVNSTGIPLKSGWNMVGNPFHYAISLANAVVAEADGSVVEPLTAGNITQGIFWFWNNGAYGSINGLEAGQGGWVKKTTSGDGYILIPDSAAAGPFEFINARKLADEEQPPAPPGGYGGGASGGGGCFISDAGSR